MPKRSDDGRKAEVADQRSDGRIEELTADLKRVQADFVNFRRRIEEERGELMDLAKRDVVTQILPFIDNLERALGHLPDALKGNDWAKGVEAVARQANDALKGLGVERIKALGETFDHNLHEAISHEGAGETVIDELQPGYKMGDKVLRHSLVKVGKGDN